MNGAGVNECLIEQDVQDGFVTCVYGAPVNMPGGAEDFLGVSQFKWSLLVAI